MGGRKGESEGIDGVLKSSNVDVIHCDYLLINPEHIACKSPLLLASIMAIDRYSENRRASCETNVASKIREYYTYKSADIQMPVISLCYIHYR